MCILTHCSCTQVSTVGDVAHLLRLQKPGLQQEMTQVARLYWHYTCLHRGCCINRKTLWPSNGHGNTR